MQTATVRWALPFAFHQQSVSTKGTRVLHAVIQGMLLAWHSHPGMMHHESPFFSWKFHRSLGEHWHSCLVMSQRDGETVRNKARNCIKTQLKKLQWFTSGYNSTQSHGSNQSTFSRGLGTSRDRSSGRKGIRPHLLACGFAISSGKQSQQRQTTEKKKEWIWIKEMQTSNEDNLTNSKTGQQSMPSLQSIWSNWSAHQASAVVRRDGLRLGVLRCSDSMSTSILSLERQWCSCAERFWATQL